MRTFGLIGFPLKQSFSQDYFSKKFIAEGIDAQYLNFEIDSIGEFPEIIDDHPELLGLNVTIPYKEKVIPFLDELDPVAEKVRAVNVIKVTQKNGKEHLIGFNSDVTGFQNSLVPLLKSGFKHALILGTGGASQAVKYVFKELGISYQLVSRNPRKSNEISYADLTTGIIHGVQIIVNTTPLGMYPNVEQCPDIPYQDLHSGQLCFDLIYNPEETLFMQKAKVQGAVVVNGMDMLIGQAEKAWKIWNK